MGTFNTECDFEQKIFDPKLAKRFKKWATFFCSKSAEIIFLSYPNPLRYSGGFFFN